LASSQAFSAICFSCRIASEAVVKFVTRAV
jgi:hypothetical protein